jgi:two-component system, OmpR family, sensor histidine kinase KdpD
MLALSVRDPPLSVFSKGDQHVEDWGPERSPGNMSTSEAQGVAKKIEAPVGIDRRDEENGREATSSQRGAVPRILSDEDETSSVVEAAGHFRIYLGAVAGVGKTYDMLNEGKRRLERGTDVVVGFAECHKRPLTEALLEGFEVVPRKVAEYRGTQFGEMDVGAVLARRPKVALVDELAHTNVPGSGPHAKRWEDVLELLDAGIDVVTTLNIQHVESLADAVEQMTGAHVRERVPDWVVRKADQVELVDSSPEQLRRRMLHGNIYAPEKVPYALSHFFQTDNLIALRELALRYLADETEEELLEHLRRHSEKRLWETRERILVAVTEAPGTDVLLRRAARMAARSKGELKVLHITASDAKPSKDGATVDSLRALAHDLGGHWHELTHPDAAIAITDFAKDNQITQIVLGSSRRSRWQELTGGGPIVRRVIRRAGDLGIDVHVIARRQLPPGFDHAVELPEES